MRLSGPLNVLAALSFVLAAGADADSFTEDFSTTTYKDAVNTTADWDTTAGELRLFPFAPAQVGAYNTPGNARGVAVSGDMAFVADVSSGLQIVDTSDPTNPVLLGSYNTSGSALGVAVDGDHAFIADSGSGLVILDISDPTNPLLLGTYNTPGFASDVEVSGDHAFVADYTGDLQVIRISNPALPTLAGTLTTPGNSDGIAVDGDHAFIADENFGLRVVDITDPTTPASIGFIDTPGSALGVAVDGDYAFLADGSNGLLVFDISDPTSPTQIGSYDTPGFAYEVAIDGDFVFVADRLNGLQVIDVTDPTNPTLAESFNTSGEARDVVVAGTHAFVAGETSGLQLINISDPAPPLSVGEYSSAGIALSIAVAGNHAFLADNSNGLLVIDITDPANPTAVGTYNTTGTPDDVAVAGDHAYVADGNSGLQVIDISNPASPTLVGTYDTPLDARSVEVAGDHAFVTDTSAGLLVIDISDPSNPALLGGHTLGAVDVVVAGDHAFVAQFTGLAILDISDPAIPALIATIATPGTAIGVEVAGEYAFVAGGTAGLHVIDISDPSSPTLAGSYDTLGSAKNVSVTGDYVFVADGAGGLDVIDISDPTNPTLASSAIALGTSVDVLVVGNHAFLVTTSNDLEVFQVFQNEVFASSNVGHSLVVDGGTDSAIRVRLSTTQTSGVGWEFSADSGANFQALGLDFWSQVTNPGTDLLWRSTHNWAPGLNPTVSDLSLEWLFQAGQITSISDVPGDQGGRVDLSFQRSADDFDIGLPNPVTGYNLYRRVDALAMGELESATVSKATFDPMPTPDGLEARPLPGERVVTTSTGVYVRGASSAQAGGTFPPGTWQIVGTAFATQSDSYTIEATTLADSSATGTNYSVYLVTTHTTTPSVWFVSSPDSGYSVDNIQPGIPTNLTFGAPSVLTWDLAPEPDFAYHTIYGSSNVLIEGAVLIGYSVDPTFDVNATPHDFYLVTTTDDAGNEGPNASLIDPTTVDVESPESPSVFALRAARPNPFRSATVIGFDLPVATSVRLRVHDAGGRQVKRLVSGSWSAGRHVVEWNGTDASGQRVAPGVYFVRIEAREFRESRRVVLLR